MTRGEREPERRRGLNGTMCPWLFLSCVIMSAMPFMVWSAFMIVLGRTAAVFLVAVAMEPAHSKELSES